MFSNYRGNYLSNEDGQLPERYYSVFTRGLGHFRVKRRENSHREHNLANLSGRFERVVRAEEGWQSGCVTVAVAAG